MVMLIYLSVLLYFFCASLFQCYDICLELFQCSVICSLLVNSSVLFLVLDYAQMACPPIPWTPTPPMAPQSLQGFTLNTRRERVPLSRQRKGMVQPT